MRGKQAEKPTSHPSSHYLWPVILVRVTGGVEPSWHQASGRSHSRHVARSKSSSPAHRLLSRPIRTTHLKNLAVSTCETKRRLQPSVSVTDLWRWWWLKAPETEKVQRLYSRLKKNPRALMFLPPRRLIRPSSEHKWLFCSVDSTWP